MDATKGNIFQILNGAKQFVIPVYQRTYSWGRLGNGEVELFLESTEQIDDVMFIIKQGLQEQIYSSS